MGQDYKQAKRQYEKACNLGHFDGCNNLAIMYAEGKGVKSDNAKAKEFFKKICEGGIKMGCENLEFLNSISK